MEPRIGSFNIRGPVKWGVGNDRAGTLPVKREDVGSCVEDECDWRKTRVLRRAVPPVTGQDVEMEREVLPGRGRDVVRERCVLPRRRREGR
ncbi:MAG TPA: hypothetical protein VIY73_19495 [Polyangiaceae bacterium]